MRYVLPTAPNVCSYTTLVNMNCQISTCFSTGTGFISTTLLLFSIPTLHACVNAHGAQFEHFLKCLGLLAFLKLCFFNFLNFTLTVCTTPFIVSVTLHYIF